MWDAIYVLITLLFFAGMLWYLLGCQRLGKGDESASLDSDAREWRAGGRDER